MSKQLRIAGDPGTLKPIIEALIFASEDPLPARTLVRLLAGEGEEVPEVGQLPLAGAGEEEGGAPSNEEGTVTGSTPEAEIATDPGAELAEVGGAPETPVEQEPAEDSSGDSSGDVGAGLIDLALPVVTTSQIVADAGEIVVDAGVEELAVARASDLVETPSEAVSGEDAGPGDIEPFSSEATGTDAEDAEDAEDTGNSEEADDADDAGRDRDADDIPEPSDLIGTVDPVTLEADESVDLDPDTREDLDDMAEVMARVEAMERADAMERAETMEPAEVIDTILPQGGGRMTEWYVGDSIDQRYIRMLIEELNQDYDETGRAFRIVEVAGGFQFATTRDFGEYVALLSKEKSRRRLSPAALETLSIIAYRQPVSKPEIEAIRGVNCDQVLLNLMEKNLISITGRSEGVGRPLLYGTTEEFLRIFGLNNVGDLPKLRELEELMEENVLSPERAEVVTVDQNSDVAEIEAKVGAAGHHEESEAAVEEESFIDENQLAIEGLAGQDVDDEAEAAPSDEPEAGEALSPPEAPADAASEADAW